jgi:hypothetical protein
MPQTQLIFKKESLANRCEICHQQDCFDPIENTCSRCAPIQEEKGILPNKHEFYCLDRIQYCVFAISSLIFFLTTISFLAIDAWVPYLRDFLPFHPGFFTLIISSVLMFFGVRQIIRRPSFILDQQKKQFTVWWGIYFSIWKNTYSFTDLDQIEISYEERRVHNTKIKVYPVKAYLKTLKKPINIDESQDYIKSRNQAKKFARYVRTTLQDISHGTIVSRPPNTLNDNLRTRLENAPMPQIPIEPPDCQIQYDTDPTNNVTLFLIPKKGTMYIVGFLLFSLIFIASAIFFWWVVPEIIILPLFMGAAGIIFLGTAIHNATLKEKILLTTNSFLLEKRSVFMNRLREIPLTELDELQIGEPHIGQDSTINFTGVALLAISDSKIIEFGQNLNPSQAQWLLDTLKYCIRTQSTAFMGKTSINKPT